MKLSHSNDFDFAAGYGRKAARRTEAVLPVQWKTNGGFEVRIQPAGWAAAAGPQSSALSLRRGRRGFTILEMLVVVGIIGFIAAMALPNLKGMTQANSMTVAVRQLTDDLNYARQRAVTSRSTVCVVFNPPPSFWQNWPNYGFYGPSQLTNLFAHQFSSYAVLALRTVGDQPGRPTVHYLTDWKTLPQGVFLLPDQITNSYSSNYVATTNTTLQTRQYFPVTGLPFLTNLFPSTYNSNSPLAPMPYIAFTATGQLATNTDQYLMLTRGSVFYPLNADGTPNFAAGPNWLETPPGISSNTPNLIHIDNVSGRVVAERNQF